MKKKICLHISQLMQNKIVTQFMIMIRTIQRGKRKKERWLHPLVITIQLFETFY